jgi:hypothetical protein
MEFIEKVFVSSDSSLFLFLSTLFPGWHTEEITKSYKGNLSAKISGVF